MRQLGGASRRIGGEPGAPSALPQLMVDLVAGAKRDGYGDKQLTALVEQMLAER